MRMLLLSAMFWASVSVASAATPRPTDIVGAWTNRSCVYQNGRWEFRANGKYEFICGQVIDGGRWELHPSGRLELISYSDYFKRTFSKDSYREVVVVRLSSPHIMHCSGNTRMKTWIKE